MKKQEDQLNKLIYQELREPKETVKPLVLDNINLDDLKTISAAMDIQKEMIKTFEESFHYLDKYYVFFF